MSYDEILAKVLEIVAEVFGVPVDSLDENSTWIDNLKIDLVSSLQCKEFVDLKVALDTEFDTDCPNMKLGRTKTMGEVARFIEDLIEE